MIRIYKNQKIIDEVEQHIAENFEFYYNSDIPVFDIPRKYLDEKYGDLLPKEEKERIVNIVVHDTLFDN